MVYAHLYLTAWQWKQPKCPMIDEWGQWVYTVIRKNETFLLKLY